MDIEKIKAYYNEGKGPWTKAMIRALVANGKISASEYREITSEAY